MSEGFSESLMSLKNVALFFERLAKQNPSPQTELNYTNTYTLLVAVALSAQSTDIGVNKATKALFKKVNTPEAMLKLGESELKKYIKTIGLYNTKAKNIIRAAEILVKDYNSTVPDSRKELIKLPGVGRKTANVILNTAFGKETFAVDTHIFRVANRTGLAKGKTPTAVEKELDKRIPSPYRLNAHNWLILLGRYCCKARKPECNKCIVADLCGYKYKKI